MLGIKTAIINYMKRRRSLVNVRTVRSLMRFFRVDEYGHEANLDRADMGYGWLHYGFIRQLKPSRVLCVGSGYGYIPAVLAQACKDNGFGQVDFIDAGYGKNDKASYTGVGYWKTLKGKLSFHLFGLDQFITLFVMTTEDFVKKYSELTYDYIYIDGDHSYQGVRKDFEYLFPLLKKNGFLVFHDVTVKEKRGEGTYGVWKLWSRLVKSNAIVFPSLHSGLGIYQKVSA